MYEKLKQIPRLTKVLGREDQYFFSLSEEDELFVRKIGNKSYKTTISQIELVEGKQIRVIDGPLKGFVGDVVKVNLHKREVAVKVGFMGREMELKLGISMVIDGHSSL